MRLHQLTVTAFGPFASTERIDFDKLTAAGLFLLRGATGAGKSSVLDAVCYALYGELPGSRKGNPLRSDHADADRRTEVVLEATLGGRRLEITRSPEQLRPKKRGSGFTPEKAQTLLREWAPDAGDGTPGWVALSRSHQEAGEELTRLLGMSRDQFCQVVLLPQGDFARFLRADSKQRADLLGRLFDTGRFEQLERWTADRKLRQEKEVQAGRQRLRDLAARAEEAAGPLAADAADHRPGEDASATEALAWAAMLRGTAAERALAARLALAAAEARHTEAGRALAAATALADRQQRHAAAVADRVRLSAADDALAPERTRLTAALAAESLAPLRTLHRTASASHAAATAQEAARRSALAALTADAPVLTAVHAAAPTALAVTQGQLATDPASPMPPQAGPDPATVSAAPATDSPDSAAVDIPRARTAPPPAVLPPLSALPSAAPAELAAAERHLRAESGRLEAARADEDRHRRLTRERADLIAERDRAEELAEESEDWLVDYEDRLKQLHTELDEARSAHALLTQLDAQRADLTLRHEAAQQHRRLHAARTAAEARTTDLHKAFLDARAHTLDLQERRLAGMAAELAEELADGAPCRVCGSAEHPAPARPSASPVTAADEQRARDAQHAAEQRFNAAQAELTALQVDEAAAAAASGGRAVAELAAEIAELAERWQAARQTAERLVPLGQQVERLERERAARADRLRQAGERSAGLAGRLGTVVVELAELAARLAEARGDAPSVAARAAALDRLTGAVADTLAAARAAAEAATRLSEATEAFAEAARSAGFADPAAVEAAHLPAAERELLRQRLQALDTALEQNRARLADPDLLAASRLPPAAPAVARAAEEDATAALRRAAAEHRSAADRVEALARIGRTLVSLAATFAPVLDAHARISRLAGLLAGAPAENALRMRLESYVLAARLEQVAAAASHRLLKMSGGRYTLVHSDGLVSGNRRSGLSLHVVDAWTGRERDTATLSGGESFFASLALALGLADVVTDEAGGMPLDTLFIDEGFGTLDENALEEVMDVLDSLRERDRAVGIVSHVADLRTRIPAQLLIRKHRHGSTVHHTTRADA